MENEITPDRIANSITMDESFKGYYLIVEGKKDHLFFSKYINDDIVTVITAFGNVKVVEVLNILDERNFSNRIGIIDTDFKKILREKIDIQGLFLTDDHDLEVMAIRTKALSDILRKYCSSENISKFNTIGGIKNIVLNNGKMMAYLKLSNKIYSLGLIFKPKTVDGNPIKYTNFICDKSLEFLGKEKLIDTVMNYSRPKSKDIKDKDLIMSRYDEVSSQKYEIYQLVNGHDLTNILYILIKKILKSKNKSLFDYSSIEESLSLAYDSSDFKKTNLYNSLDKWARENKVELFNERIQN